MITKEELNKKKAQSSEQLDLVETISSSDIVRKKRRLVIIAIIATIGLSLSLWAYREIRSFNFSTLSPPDLSLPKAAAPSLDSQIANVLGSNKSQWVVSVSTDSQITANISQLKHVSNSYLKDTLPEGIDVKELSSNQQIDVLITVPQKKIYISLKYSGSDQNYFKSTVAQLVPAVYWYTIQNNSI